MLSPSGNVSVNCAIQKWRNETEDCPEGFLFWVNASVAFGKN